MALNAFRIRKVVILVACLLGASGTSTSRAQAAFVPGSAVRALTQVDGKVFLATSSEVLAIDTATGERVPDFAVSVTATNPGFLNGGITSLAAAGGRLFVGGSFTAVNGRPRSNLAAVSLRSGALLDRFRAATDRPVLAVAATASTAFAGGLFASVGGVSTGPLVALDARTGRTRQRFAQVESRWRGFTGGVCRFFGGRSVVRALAISDGRLYLGGVFSSIGGERRAHLAAVALSTGKVDVGFSKGNVNCAGEVRAIVPDAQRLLVGGIVRSVGGLPMRGVAAVSKRTGAPDPRFAKRYVGATATAQALAEGPDAIYAYFGWGQPSVTKLSRDSGAVLGQIRVGQNIRSMVAVPGRVYLGSTTTPPYLFTLPTG